MTIKEFIEKHLQNCEYGAELSKEAEQEAKENGFVVVFGASDDLCEFRGAVEEEAECWCGGNLYINSKGDIVGNEQPEYKLIEAVWGNSGASWTYETDIPHETFTVTEDGEPYCIGIVFRLADCADKMTNYDRIKAMSVEEMGNFFDDISDSCASESLCDECPLQEGCTHGVPFREWLESEVQKSE